MDGYDVVILGGGPGGYVAAIRAAQLKLKTALVERDEVGGICLNWGCIPSKALLRNAEILSLFHHATEYGIRVDGVQADFGAAIDRSRGVVDRMVKGVQFLLRKHGVTTYRGSGTLRSASEIEISDGSRLSAKQIILATGARARELPGIAIDRERVITSREALERRELPASAVIIGAGPVGMEFAYVWRSYGAEVTLVEALPHLLPQEDEEISTIAEKEFAKQGMTVLTGAKVVSARAHANEGGAVVEVETPEGVKKLSAEVALVGIGVQGNSDNLGLEALGVRLERSFVPVDERMATNVPGVYAIGDLTGPPLLAHVASAQGVNCVETIAGLEPPALDYEQMPRATYCQPEVASIGLTEAQARERGLKYTVGRFPFRANGRALALAEQEGMVKLLAEQGSGDLLGVHLIGPGVTELLGELSLARSLEATPEALGYAVHAHPTLSEAVKEAALSARGEVIHVWQG
ncbi:MAG TPA: dihydrolipoyl dehydrogenase [Dehalococcoidia bacterium]|nr:dihydrolipoyl dehydrogenase [Dehalococcoidia bacterium]